MTPRGLKTLNTKGKVAEWAGCEWTVQMSVNSRMHVHSITAFCRRTKGERVSVGSATITDIGPFDDIERMVNHCCEDAAIDSVDNLMAEEILEDVELPGFADV